MCAIKLIIADENKNYTKGLAQYLQEECGQVFEVICFTQGHLLLEYLNKSEAVDILLINPQLISKDIEVMHSKSVVLLVENVDKDKANSIYKYQRADKIKKLLLQEYDRNTNCGINILNNHAKCKLICVYSASGAAGKTTIAYNLAHQYSMKGKKVLYISLEPHSALTIFKQNESTKGLIYMLYLIKSKLPNLLMKLNAMIANDHNTNINFIERELNVLEYKDIKIGDMNLLTDFLINQTDYEAIILDLDSSVSEMVLGAFKYSDVIINVYSGDKTSSAKYENFKKQISKVSSLLEQDISNKLLDVWNKREALMESEYIEGLLAIPFIQDEAIGSGAYFPEMTYFKKIYDAVENSNKSSGENI
jgi:cellulose biosynthesis protein BcsQ